MSADNWCVCPRCQRRHEQFAKAARIEADNSYGKVPLEDWKLLDAQALASRSPIGAKSFREDWDISGADVGAVEISYSGHCDTCGLSVKFSHTEQIKDIDA